jgi:hypothetical protein
MDIQDTLANDLSTRGDGSRQLDPWGPGPD